jgi:hypothetical protein
VVPPALSRTRGWRPRVASGPGFWMGWMAELDRKGLPEELLADGVIARALREAPTGHRSDREDDRGLRPGRLPVPGRRL